MLEFIVLLLILAILISGSIYALRRGIKTTTVFATFEGLATGICGVFIQSRIAPNANWLLQFAIFFGVAILAAALWNWLIKRFATTPE
jgi:hypothetical protein